MQSVKAVKSDVKHIIFTHNDCLSLSLVVVRNVDRVFGNVCTKFIVHAHTMIVQRYQFSNHVAYTHNVCVEITVNIKTPRTHFPEFSCGLKLIRLAMNELVEIVIVSKFL